MQDLELAVLPQPMDAAGAIYHRCGVDVSVDRHLSSKDQKLAARDVRKPGAGQGTGDVV